MDGEAEDTFSPVTMEVWSSSASEVEEEDKSISSLVNEVVDVDKTCLNSNNNNNNNNKDILCREVTQGEISWWCVMMQTTGRILCKESWFIIVLICR